MSEMTPEERRAFAKKLAHDNPLNKPDPNDPLSHWERESFFGGSSVQLRLPLRDPVEVRRHLGLIEQTIHDLRVHLDQVNMKDRSALLTVHGSIRTLNQRLNAYKNPRR